MPYTSAGVGIDAGAGACAGARAFVVIFRLFLGFIRSRFVLGAQILVLVVNIIAEKMNTGSNLLLGDALKKFRVVELIEIRAPNVKLMFENENLNNASPATVSRAGIIFVSGTDLGWKPIIEAWVAKRREAERNLLAPIFEK